ncbi:hypothetical protein [Aliidiomarina sanyensis]|uniref:Uncharacterized protein n=1 Tax=Aliidiomarina sanyensis TaxID=1249555 RepID=A0A432WB37_9GAMM|nr:hypothetical protein [Aliidiomarina sanyensis]RUO28185.1 hypothetical protein CWE11_10780 [Aliidiomarina sanyensis]
MKKGIYITLGVLFGLAVIGAFVEDEQPKESYEQVAVEVSEPVPAVGQGDQSEDVVEDERAQLLAEKAAYYEGWIEEVKRLRAQIETAKEAWWQASPDDDYAAGQWGAFAQSFRQQSQKLMDDWRQPSDIQLVFEGFSSQPGTLVSMMLNPVAFRNTDEYEERVRLYNEALVSAEQFIQEHK